MSPYRIPTPEEVAAFADDLAARVGGSRQALYVFADVWERDACLMFEGAFGAHLVAAMEATKATDPCDDDSQFRPNENWRQGLAELGLLTLAAKHSPDAAAALVTSWAQVRSWNNR